jgi:uncharacterized cupin superfamily protein
MLSGHLVRQPSGQGSPWHSSPRDVIFIQLAGEVDFAAAGQTSLLRPRDILVMPAGIPYSYRNVSLVEAVFFDIGGPRPVGAGPVYYQSNPGWPVRSDTKRPRSKSARRYRKTDTSNLAGKS